MKTERRGETSGNYSLSYSTSCLSYGCYIGPDKRCRFKNRNWEMYFMKNFKITVFFVAKLKALWCFVKETVVNWQWDL